MELHLRTSVQQSEEQKENASKIMIKLYRKKKPEARASSFPTQKRHDECDMSFNSTQALFGHSRIHQKSNRGAKKMTFLGSREAKHADVMAACILMGIRRSKSETDIDDAKRSKLKWICTKIERHTKKTKEVVPSVLPAVGADEMEMHPCDKCAKVFNSGQALGGHKRAHYAGPPLYRPEKQQMELQSSTPLLGSVEQKDIFLKIRTKLYRSEKNASSSLSCNGCTECEMSFSSTKALFEHLRIHRKSNRGVGKRSLLRLGQAKKGEDVLAACILMEMRQSKSETTINDAKLSQLRWVCAKIERERRKKMKETVSKHSDNNLDIICRMVSLTPSMLALREHNVDQRMISNSNKEVKIMAEVGAMEVEMHQCDKCDKSFSSGQALGGHKRAHYTGPPLCRPGRDRRLSAVAVAERVLVHHINLN